MRFRRTSGTARGEQQPVVGVDNPYHQITMAAEQGLQLRAQRVELG